ncbi:rhomboid family intramembrane serine protease [Shimia thalassica]|uniref:Rhomboid family protein n=1 Tax=Shimia thalassica TaxID=1715693 RepID=A0A0P1ID28_9RHOB|nr:rhomboid family intramembrane serine protease [Shimia thalassica]PHO04327.1 rhomboid family intramembrane serine protease [Rhodobacteraceae bacterium 4F10]MBU2943727.1 rhomboid family intramembrane serine protease [Shimia thalassica]MDO6485829.1 rhomboid family intramembrane serine protease [Shimia thalassica]MDO6501798.1 rhomboid family intramembrane serine protease [Shimia thalassica]MDO6800458.1 rhomboid family intramembrane serine protease [Shimia thalassica]
MSQPDNNSPINPLPPVVVALFLLIAGVEVVFSLGARGLVGDASAIGWRVAALQKYAFSGEIFDWMLSSGVWPFEHVMRFVTYLFVHGNFTHAAFASVMLLALGKMVGEVFSAFATLAVFILSGIVGALAFALILDNPAPLFGAYPGVYGLIGAFTFLLWTRLGQMGENQARAFSLIGFLVGLQLLFGLVFGGNQDWVADVAGFITGFVMSFFLIPGGWARIRSKIRHD